MSISDKNDFSFISGTSSFKIELYSNGSQEIPIVRTHEYVPRLLRLDEVTETIELLEEYKELFSDKDIEKHDVLINGSQVVYDIDIDGLIGRRKLNVLPGWVYLISAIDIGLYKIGYSKDPSNRLQQLSKQQIPSRLGMICKIQTSHMITLEKELHEKYKHKRRHGEWFALIDAEIEEIKLLAENAS